MLDATVGGQAAIDMALAGAGVMRVLYYQLAQAVAHGRLGALLARYKPKPFPVSLVCPAGRLVPLKLASAFWILRRPAQNS
jgi:DNA-binding transcriptional LysR family regulator